MGIVRRDFEGSADRGDTLGAVSLIVLQDTVEMQRIRIVRAARQYLFILCARAVELPRLVGSHGAVRQLRAALIPRLHNLGRVELVSELAVHRIDVYALQAAAFRGLLEESTADGR
jgi:hypothetical protein